MNHELTQQVANLIKKRRTRKPSQFKKSPPPSSLIWELVDFARHAPNHHRTEPARFYLLDPEQIQKIGMLFGEVVKGDGEIPELLEKGDRKAKEWAEAPGLLILTQHTDPGSLLSRNRPEVFEEDYATCCCIAQNILLLMEAEGIASKWSTGPVWDHPSFNSVVGVRSPKIEKVVALLFYGYSDQALDERKLAPLEEHMQGSCF